MPVQVSQFVNVAPRRDPSPTPNRHQHALPSQPAARQKKSEMLPSRSQTQAMNKET
jgi:hypothetical protein